MVYTDGSAKQVQGWWQAGYGPWFGDADERSTGLPVPVTEPQSVSSGELRGGLYALEQRRAAAKMVIVLDSEYVYKGITEWSPRWQHHGWRVKSREVGHRDVREAIFCLRQSARALLKFVWTPSHMQVEGNGRANNLAEDGREQHPNNKRRREAQEEAPHLWREMGLSPMRSDVSSSEPSGPGSVLSSCSSVGGGLVATTDSSSDTSSSSGSSVDLSSSSGSGLGFSTDVSEGQRERKRRRLRDNQDP